MNEWGQKVKEKMDIENNLKEKLNKVLSINKSLNQNLNKIKTIKENLELDSRNKLQDRALDVKELSNGIKSYDNREKFFIKFTN